MKKKTSGNPIQPSMLSQSLTLTPSYQHHSPTWVFSPYTLERNIPKGVQRPFIERATGCFPFHYNNSKMEEGTVQLFIYRYII